LCAQGVSLLYLSCQNQSMVKYFISQPLPTSFMLISIIGLLFSALVVWQYSVTWGFAFCVVFTTWFIASVYNFTHAPGEKHLDIHGSSAYLRKR